MTYLVPAYLFATIVLGGYLAWSLRSLVALSKDKNR